MGADLIFSLLGPESCCPGSFAEVFVYPAAKTTICQVCLELVEIHCADTVHVDLTLGDGRDSTELIHAIVNRHRRNLK